MHAIIEEEKSQPLPNEKTKDKVFRLSRRNIDGGWAWVVLVACYGAMFITSVTIYSGGLLYIVWLEKYRESKTKTALIGSLYISMVCLLGTGTAFIVIPLSIVLGYYFTKKRNTVLSMLTVCAAFGMFLSTPFTSFFLEKFGMNVTFIALAALQCQICITAVICKPSALEKLCKKRTKDTQHRAKSKSKYLHYCGKWLGNMNVLNNISFVLYLLSTVAWNLSQSVVLLHLPYFIKVKEFGDIHIYLVMCTFSICNALGRFLGALTMGKGGLDGILIHFGSLGIISVVSMTFPLYSDIPAGSYILAGVTGFYTGAPNALMTPIAVDIAGIEHLASSNGLCYFASGIGYLIGPPLAGFLISQSGVFETSFVISGAVIFTGSLFAVASSYFRRPPDVIDDKTKLSLLSTNRRGHDIVTEKNTDISSETVSNGTVKKYEIVPLKELYLNDNCETV